MGVNPKCIDESAVLKWTNHTKLYIFAAKHKVYTYNEELFPSDDCVSIWSWPPVRFMTSRETQEYLETKHAKTATLILLNYEIF